MRERKRVRREREVRAGREIGTEVWRETEVCVRGVREKGQLLSFAPWLKDKGNKNRGEGTTREQKP